MGFLFLIVCGIVAMIFVARLASKTKRKEEGVAVSSHRYASDESAESSVSAKSQKVDLALQKGLISLLLKKKIIGEEELLAEINRIKNDQSFH